MKQNITLSLDKELIRKLKHVAIERKTSISGLLTDQLKRVLEHGEEYEEARKSAVTLLKRGLNLGGKIRATRDELHER